MTTSHEALNHWITTGKAIAVTNTNPNNVHVLIHRYDGDNFAVQELEVREPWHGPGNLAWAVKSVHGVFSIADALQILNDAGLTNWVYGNDPSVPERLRSYVARCVIPMEWHSDYLTSPLTHERVRLYIPAGARLALT